MNKIPSSLIFAGLYLLAAGFAISVELYKRIYDRGNSEMAGLASYLLTMPSSFFTDWVSTTIFGVKIGDSDTSFVLVLGSAAILNALLIYLIVTLLGNLFHKLN